MKLEDQVCSLELAKRLKELGVTQDSYFEWYRKNQKENYVLGLVSVWETADPNPWIAAFTVAELGEMLPKGYYTYKDTPVTNLSASLWYGQDHDGAPSWSGEKEADVRAKMLIHLIEKGIIKP